MTSCTARRIGRYRRSHPVWAGLAELKRPEIDDEDMHLIAPLRVGRGYRHGIAYSVTGLRILKNCAG